MPVPDVALDRSSPVPLYYQVATRLEQLIDEGELPAGSRLENEIELADRLGVSRPTMRRAAISGRGGSPTTIWSPTAMRRPHL